ARSKLNRAQTGARLRVAPGTCVPVVAIRATEIPPSQPLYRGFPEVSHRYSVRPAIASDLFQKSFSKDQWRRDYPKKSS
ncbi:MAG: hypothetical protein ACK5GN_02040, partial [Pseudomonadota bacterium]